MDYQVGTLYLGFNRNGIPTFTQPGGPGTTVFPQAPTQSPEFFMGFPQVPMSYPSLYVAGCGHQFNEYEIFCAFQPSLGIQVAVIACPICSYVQELMPYTEYQSYISTPLVTA